MYRIIYFKDTFSMEIKDNKLEMKMSSMENSPIPLNPLNLVEVRVEILTLNLGSF